MKGEMKGGDPVG